MYWELFIRGVSIYMYNKKEQGLNMFMSYTWGLYFRFIIE